MREHITRYGGYVFAVIAGLGLLASHIDTVWKFIENRIFSKQNEKIVSIALQAGTRDKRNSLDEKCSSNHYLFQNDLVGSTNAEKNSKSVDFQGNLTVSGISEWPICSLATSYQVINSADIIEIEPVGEWLDRGAESNPIHGYESIWTEIVDDFEVATPGINFTVINNTKDSILLHEILVEVSKSKTTREVLFMIDSNIYKVGYFTIYNEGWASPHLIDVYYDVASVSDLGKIDFNNMRFHKSLYFGRKNYVDVEFNDAVRAIGGLPDRMLELQERGKYFKRATCLFLSRENILMREPTVDEASSSRCFSSMESDHDDIPDDPRTLETLALLSEEDKNYFLDSFRDIDREFIKETSFNNVTILLFGRIEWTTYNPEKDTKAFHFIAPGHLFSANAIGGGGPERSAIYDVTLSDSGQNYTLRKPLDHFLRPTEADSFDIFFNSDKSSKHEMKLRFRYNDDKFFETKAIKLNYIMPRSISADLY